MLARSGRSRIDEVKNMLIPVRCFSCNKVIGGHYEQFIERRANGEDPSEVMDDLGVSRYCCRTIFVSHVNLIDELLPYG